MNLTKNLINRELDLNKNKNLNSYDFAFSKVSLCYEYVFNDLMDVGAPPLAMSLNNSLICAANDGGDVSVINKNKLCLINKWSAHNNAIFDIKWRHHSTHQLGTASGDKSIIIWDINRGESKCSIVEKLELAHNGSIKSIDFQDYNVFASGSRDGLIKIWDLRCSRGGSVLVIESAHLSKLPSIKSSPKSKPQRSSPLNSVTSVLFHPLNHNLYSSGANDGVIKVWDLRKCKRNKLNSKTSSIPIRQLYQSKRVGSPAHGFTSLTFTDNYRLFASCSDHNIYGYSGDNKLPTIALTGHQVNNFTRITCIDSNYLVSGSVNGKAFIWPINCDTSKTRKVWPIYCLPHSEEEVTAIVCDNDLINIYTCCDDQKISKWSSFSCNHKLKTVTKSQIFVPKESEVEVIEEVKSTQITPPLNNIRPFSSLTNWLETSGKQHTTPSNSNPKRIRLTQSTPTNRRVFKENNTKSSKRKLFINNRKISDYFTP